ncbi:hypothetical protein Tsubulata_012845 [Turnera subulata]|uniref:Uncharacterized protein n=1 Tax=Turnera subulata TaxID=218843 RepID=A0A9Q0JBT5_9ROSI|nr:hypothetical protein Tsubulata_012845 [Turnera subulata]
MVTKEKDEELALFLELRRREKDKDRNNFLLPPPNNSDAPPPPPDTTAGTGHGASPPATRPMSFPPHRKTAAEKFLDSENDKSDYDWLLTPPGTPLFPSLEMESQRTAMSQIGMSNARPTALKARLTNIQEEPASKTNIVSKRTTVATGLNSSSTGTRRPSSSAGTRSSSRPATPTGRPSLAATAKPSRASTPTSRPTLSSSKPAAPPSRSSTPSRATARSSTPTARPAARSSTPTARPSAPALSKPTPRSATPTRLPSSTSAPIAAAPRGRSSSVSKSVPTTSKNPVPSRGSSPTVRPRPWKPNEMPGFSLDAPPNLRTSVPERPASASRGRPGVASGRSSSIDSGSSGRPRQQSCSPSRGRAPNGNLHGSRSSNPAKSRAQSNGNDDVNPVLMGTKMVERVVNMRKLAPPKQEDHHSTLSNSAGKSSSIDTTGFGRTLSKKSLDMALRHMDIRRSVQGNNLRPLMTNIPASSMYSVRSGGSAKSRTISVLDSPLATSSNASSEPSVNNNSFFVDGIEIEDNDFGSERGNHSPSSHRGR